MPENNCTQGEFEARRREVAAAMLTGTKAPERHYPPLPAGAETDCIYAEDTGERAFVNLPCRGNRIICRRVEGLMSFAANCRPEKCQYHTEKSRREKLCSI